MFLYYSDLVTFQMLNLAALVKGTTAHALVWGCALREVAVCLG